MSDKRFCLVILLSVVFGVPASGTIIHVPGDSATIQAGINGAVTGDTVLVSPDTFPENIDLGGKSIVVASLLLTSGDTSYISQTLIDGGGSGVGQSVVSFTSGENSLCTMVGFTITNGWCADTHGGGITVKNGSGPRIEDCRIVSNGGPSSWARGAGIYCTGSDPVFERCLIQHNSITENGNYDHTGGGVYLASGASPTFTECQIMDNDIAASYWRNYGGGVYCNGSSAIFQTCLFSGNSANRGGGMEATNSSNVLLRNCYFIDNYASGQAGAIGSWYSSSVEIDSCTIYGNRADGEGGALYTANSGIIDATHTTITDNSASLGAGVYAVSGTSPVLTDCIIFYNWYNEVYPSDLTDISYCDVRGGYTGTGNLDTDPLFCDWVNNEYQLAGNSLCLTSGSGGGLIGYYGSGCSAIYPQTRRVPLEYMTIQEAILASYEGDTVLVAPDTFPENIDFWGRRILLTSNYLTTGDTSYISQTVIDGGGSGVGQSVVSFIRNEDSLSFMTGFTITNGYCSESHGGGMTVTNGSSPRIEDCRIVENSGPSSWARGIGIYCTGSGPVFERCLIQDNSITENGNYDHTGGGVYLASGADAIFTECQIKDNEIAYSYHRNYGGGVYCDGASATFQTCLFSGNTADLGGGIEATNSSNVILRNCYFSNNYARHEGGAVGSWYSSSVEVDSCTIYSNRADGNGGALYTANDGQIDATHTTITANIASLGAGVYGASGTSPILIDCIIFYNWYNEIYPSDLADISYCDVRGGHSGTGNLDIDPLFCDWVNGDYHLAGNSLCLTSGSGGGLIGYYGSGCSAIYPQTRRVPLEYMTIQEAILASYEGDTVLVAPDTFPENIDFWGRRILLTSNYLASGDTSDISQTVIDGGGSESVVSFIRNEDSLSFMTGFTITNGWCSESHGGGITVTNGSSPRIEDCRIVGNSGPASWACGVGIYCTGSGPVFERCLIQDNSITENGNYDHYGAGAYIASGADPTFTGCQIMDNEIAYSYWRNYGGGVYCNGSSPTFQTCLFSGNTADLGGGIQATNSSNVALRNCYFSNNYARNQGGGVYCNGSISTSINDLFCYNTAGSDGGGIYAVNCDPSLTNVTMNRNSAGSNGGGICCNNSSPTVTNAILWANSAANGSEIFVHSGTPIVTYSDVQGSWPSTGNIDTDPFFDDTVRFFLSDSSPCIDVGNPDSVYNDIENPSTPGLALWPSLGSLRNDMGAYGGPDALIWTFPVGIEERKIVRTGIPKQFTLYQNYPNPFSAITHIRFALPKSAEVKIEVYNALGQRVAVLLNGHRPPGYHVTRFDARRFASGLYFYRIETDSFSAAKKMLLME